MWDLLPKPVLGAFSLLVLIVNTFFWTSLLFLVFLIKKMVPRDGWRRACDRLIHELGQNWIGCNCFGLECTKKIRWDIQGIDNLKRDAWYLVLANHQSWVDIVVLQKIFHRRIPFLKFFLKKELIWVPMLGTAWWALDFPFVRRDSSVRKDFETTRKACEKFKSTPVSVMNFVEGTRFTQAKHEQQNSPYANLLKPKAAGIALVLDALREEIHSILDVTIVYPEGVLAIWPFLCSRSMEIKVLVREIPVTGELIGDYLEDRAFRRPFSNWLNGLWEEKDRLIGSMHRPAGAASEVAEEI
ncbi:MAG: acyltransferase [Syntrophobacteraceae bacterium]|nr:acyltransferase [Desulfobacteraceae bacterium]